MEVEALRASIARIRWAMLSMTAFGVLMLIFAGVLAIQEKDIPEFVSVGIGSMITGVVSIAAMDIGRPRPPK